MTLPRRIWHVGTMMLLLLFLLSARLVYWQLLREELKPPLFRPIVSAAPAEGRLIKRIDSETLERFSDLPQPAQQRAAALLAQIDRGAILDRHGQPLAFDEVGEQDTVERRYPLPAAAPVVGYVSRFGLGLAGAELAFNEELLGLDRLDSNFRRMINRPIDGSDVYLTLDSRTQAAAVEAMAGRPGAVVVMDGVGGGILAMVSNPSYDPNRILDPEYAEEILNCPGGDCPALLNRATQGLYTPGSTWKTVTLIAALDSGQVTPETVFDFGEPRRGPDGIYYVYEVDGAEVIDPNHDERRLNLVQSYAVSANAAFARLGDEMPPQSMIDYTTDLGFGEASGPTPLEIGAGETQIAADLQELIDNNVLQAATGFGQGELLVTPLSMAVMVTAVINQGDIPQPHLMWRVEAPSGRIQEQAGRQLWREDVMRPETAQLVADMMVEAARRSTGVSGSIPGVTIGGKTGTAQLGGDQAPHAWFIGFAHDGQNTVAIAVVAENAGSGSRVAAPIFAQVAQAALQHLAQPPEEGAP